MKVHIEDWSAYWRKREGFIEVPDGLTREELVDFLHEEFVNYIATLAVEEKGVATELDTTTVATLPDGSTIVY